MALKETLVLPNVTPITKTLLSLQKHSETIET